MEFQAVWQKLHGTRELLGAVAERPEHGGGVSHQNTASGRGDEALEFVEPSQDNVLGIRHVMTNWASELEPCSPRTMSRVYRSLSVWPIA